MAQRPSHVPKFGDWDNDNVPYTAYFDNARKEKTGVRMNPNDPEENPEAFKMYARSGGMVGDVHDDFASGVHEGTTTAEKHNNTEGLQGQTSNAHWISPSDHRNRKSITSESGSEKSNSDQSLLQAQKTAGLGGQGTKPLSSSRHSRLKSGGAHPSHHDGHHRAASIPKFGAWDEADPKSGEGFTMIFNRVKEEKQVASATFPSVANQPANYSTKSSKNHQGNSSSRSKFCCCFYPRGK